MIKDIYKTGSLYESSYLVCAGLKMTGREFENEKVVLLFVNSSKLDKEVMNFHNGTGKASAKDLFNSYRMLKDFVFDYIKNNRR